jgi:hypothetical protein
MALVDREACLSSMHALQVADGLKDRTVHFVKLRSERGEALRS